MIRQFDVVAHPGPSLRVKVPYLLVLQSRLLSALNTVAVAPMIRSEIVPADRVVSIPATFENETFAVAVGLLANVAVKRLGRSVGSLAHDYHAIRRALDRLFTGF